MLIYEFPFSCVRVILLSMLKICNSHYPMGEGFLLLCLYRDGVHLHTTAAKTKPNLSVNEFVSKVLEFVHPLRCSSNWCVAHYTGSVMCRLISYSLLHSVKLSLGIKKLLTNTQPITAHCIVTPNGPAVAQRNTG